ncbi:MAG TPA: hypothetical protein EYO51_01110 [Methylococcaceae bacterium]|nr:hypothetical protein [Methylococcaceae bacterium]HIB61756.1 hypothetical protein [Methylococcaceae bacterium]HIN67931.1 hypothetical protein [Methylococcales bacterium]HIO43932.1 hypothetical protein [Methylococcales bacterium]
MTVKKSVHARVFFGLCLSIFLSMLMGKKVLAKDNWYHFELIVFEQTRANTETFAGKLTAIKLPRKHFDLTHTTFPKSLLLINPIQFARLNTDDFYLQSSYRQLLRRKDYHPLIHTAWLQSVKSDSSSKSIIFSAPFAMNNADPVQGSITLERGYYLHLKVQFELEKEGVFYLIDQRRRIRLSETHYFDHPMFGVIIYVERLDIETAAISK